MATTSTLGPVSSSIHRIYDVFLSFRGEDTRNNFVDHLHAALKRKGIISFRDEEKLERGKVISQELMQAIKDSEYAIVVISSRYAFSKWCLMELTKIIECKSKTGLKVLPIFYNVDPSDVRRQKSSFGQAFDEHEKDPEVRKEWIETWKTALNDVGSLSGWHIHNSPESEIIESISRKILEELRHGFPNRFNDLVGMGSHIEKIIALLRMGSEGVRFVGIWGMGGIGKTTLARAIYNRVSPQFEVGCFVANVREETKTKNQGLPHLQTQIIYKILQESGIKIFNTHDGIDVLERRVRNKNVFIVLDDVDSKEQLKALAGSRDWFSPRSRVVLTSRDQHLLKPYVDKIYELKQLNTNESLELFSQKAFKKDQPMENYIELSKDIVGYAQGLPLALEIIGSLLYDRPLVAWEATREKLKVHLDLDICKILKISYDELDDFGKELFLDIAYLFKGQYDSNMDRMLKALHPYFGIYIEVLKDRCLIKYSIECFKFRMHDLLQKIGQQIVHQESPDEPGKRSRLGCFDCIHHVSRHDSVSDSFSTFKGNHKLMQFYELFVKHSYGINLSFFSFQATNSIEKIVLQPPFDEGKHLSLKIFSKMTKLKMLVIGNFEDKDISLHGLYCNYPRERYDFFSHLHWDGNDSKFTLSNELCFLQWPDYHLQSLPNNFQPKNLVELKMPYNRINGKWGGWKALDNLKHIDMRDSVDLIEILDLSGIPNLQSLDLRNCHKLRKVHASLGFLKRLQELNMEGCQRLERFLDVISLESLRYLNLSGCSRLKAFPNIQGHMSSLTYMDLTETMIRELPSSFNGLSSLEYLTFCGSLRCQKIPQLFYMYSKVTRIFSWPQWRDGEGFLRRQALDVERNGSTPWFFFPNVFSNPSKFLVPDLSSLKELDLSYLNLPDATFPDLSSLSSIKYLNLSGNKLTTIPYSICQLPNLVELHLRDCKSLQRLELLSRLRSLRVLNLAYCNLSEGMIPDNLGFLSSLESLSLSGNKFRKIPYLVQLSMLCILVLDDCAELKVLPELPLNLYDLNLSNCPSLEICCCEMDPSTSSGRLSSDNCSFMAIYFDSDGRPYKIPHVPQPKNINKFFYDVTVGIARASGIPDWFNRRISSSFGTIEHRLQSTSYSWEGCVLLILYEVHEHGSSDNGTSDGSTRTLPQFVCQFQFNKIGTRKSLCLCAPEVPSVGLNGLWVFINRSWLLRGSGPEVEGCLECSIESRSLNVEVRECRARSVNWEDFSEFSEVINSISPHALDFKLQFPLGTYIHQ